MFSQGLLPFETRNLFISAINSCTNINKNVTDIFFQITNYNTKMKF